VTRAALAALAVLAVFVAGCAARPAAVQPSAAATGSLSLAADDRMIVVPAGRFIAGSTPEERATAYDDFRRTAAPRAASAGSRPTVPAA
jgi:hypothetical protein